MVVKVADTKTVADSLWQGYNVSLSFSYFSETAKIFWDCPCGKNSAWTLCSDASDSLLSLSTGTNHGIQNQRWHAQFLANMENTQIRLKRQCSVHPVHRRAHSPRWMAGGQEDLGQQVDRLPYFNLTLFFLANLNIWLRHGSPSFLQSHFFPNSIFS